jgi:hypothetical protein
MTLNVTCLRARDAELIDGEVFQVLRYAVGNADAEDLVEDAAFQLVERLSRLELLADGGSLAEIDRLAQSIADLSGRIGLRTMQQVACDVSCCAQRADAVALKAVMARMVRIGEESLFSLARYID